MRNTKKNRSYQSRKNQQSQRRSPDDTMKRLTVLGADINITEGVTIPVPRDEYDELLYCSALMDILHKLYKTGDKYAASDLMEKIFQEPNSEKEDK